MSAIIVLSGKSRGFIFRLKSAAASVGRDEECDIQIIDDLVSRRHMEIRPLAGGDGRAYEAFDLGSSNGVYIEGERITHKPLADGTVIEIGDSKLLYTEREFPDHDSALDFYKLRGEGVRRTMIARPGQEPADP